MYQIDDIGSTFASLPPNLQTVENECFGYALDMQMKKFCRLARNLTIWSDMQDVDTKYYDYMALCIKAPYYKSEYPDETKLHLLQTAISAHRYAGTQRAIDELINIVFEKASFIPWYEYNGKPYRFNVQVYDVLTEDATEVFTSVLKEVKAARSILDNIKIGREVFGNVFTGICEHTQYKNATIREAYKFEKKVEHADSVGAVTVSSAKPAYIKERYNTENEITNGRYQAAVQTQSQKNAFIKEAYEINNTSQETIYAGIGIDSIQKNIIKEETHATTI